ncbi:hypothetical protein [Mobiluncus mulieris]|uniref:hypothetical protein n=1 Tax=Mobiluncus mulieris TaxID=2052 RepID=UPI002432F753|nr:hypothetical protein [Mobiluncus mulieris]
MLFKDMDWAQRKNIKECKSYFTILEEVKQEALKLPNIISLDETTRNHFAYRFSSVGDVVTHLRSNFMTLCFDETRCLKILSTNLPDSCNPNRTSLCFLLTHYNENLRVNIQTSLVQDKTFDFSGLESLIPGMQEWIMRFETNRTKMESKLSSQVTELIRSYSADKIRSDNQF